jgi:hypothetical protein
VVYPVDQGHRLNIRHHEQALEERDEHREKGVEAAGIPASQPRTSREYKQAVWDFGMSRPPAETHDQRAKKLAGPRSGHSGCTGPRNSGVDRCRWARIGHA